jgi:hypothetical protein
MTAKDIPTQSNFSDCGLYLCMYLEQFVANATLFIRRILQREGDSQQWPERIESEELRSRLRELVLEAHRRQEKEPSKYRIPDVGNIMIEKDASRPNLPKARASMTEKDVAEAKERFAALASERREGLRHASAAPTTSPKQASSQPGTRPAQSMTEKRKHSASEDEDDPVLISAVRKTPRKKVAPPDRHGIMEQDVQVPASPPSPRTKPSTHITPRQLGEGLRKRPDEGSSSHQRQRITSAHKKQPTDEPMNFLNGIEAYATQERSVSPPDGLTLNNDIQVQRSPEPNKIQQSTTTPTPRPGRTYGHLKKKIAPENRWDVIAGIEEDGSSGRGAGGDSKATRVPSVVEIPDSQSQDRDEHRTAGVLETQQEKLQSVPVEVPIAVEARQNLKSNGQDAGVVPGAFGIYDDSADADADGRDVELDGEVMLV